MRELRLESFALQEGSQQSRQFHIVVDDEYPHGSNVSRRPTSACHVLLLFTYVYMKYKQGLRTPRKMEVEGTRSHETLHESIDRRRAGGTRSKSAWSRNLAVGPEGDSIAILPPSSTTSAVCWI